MENIEINETSKNDIILDLNAQSYLIEAGKWARFLGIMGFILTGFIVLASFFMGAIFAGIGNLNHYSGDTSSMAGFTWLITVFYLLFAAIYFFFSLYLYQFGNKIKQALIFQNSGEITNGLEKLKSFFKLWGISTIVIIGLYILIIIGTIIFATTMQH